MSVFTLQYKFVFLLTKLNNVCQNTCVKYEIEIKLIDFGAPPHHVMPFLTCLKGCILFMVRNKKYKMTTLNQEAL